MTNIDLKPQQPLEDNGQTHDNKCPCDECETWANALLDWEEALVQAGINPWKCGGCSAKNKRLELQGWQMACPECFARVANMKTILDSGNHLG